MVRSSEMRLSISENLHGFAESDGGSDAAAAGGFAWSAESTQRSIRDTASALAGKFPHKCIWRMSYRLSRPNGTCLVQPARAVSI